MSKKDKLIYNDISWIQNIIDDYNNLNKQSMDNVEYKLSDYFNNTYTIKSPTIKKPKVKVKIIF